MKTHLKKLNDMTRPVRFIASNYEIFPTILDTRTTKCVMLATYDLNTVGTRIIRYPPLIRHPL
jgi:hypothetical protein